MLNQNRTPNGKTVKEKIQEPLSDYVLHELGFKLDFYTEKHFQP